VGSAGSGRLRRGRWQLAPESGSGTRRVAELGADDGSAGGPSGIDGGSAADRVAEVLREELLSGRHRPGQRLKEQELAARFRTGRYTVRSAVRSLVASGLLDHRANRGATVPLLTPERVDAIADHREVLEVGALRLALRRGADLGAVVAATRALEQLPEDTTWVDVVVAHHRIHHELVRAAGNVKLLEAYGRCEEELRFIVSTVRPSYTASRLADLHRQLLAGIQQGGDAAVRALECDLRTGRAAVLDALRLTCEEDSEGLASD
jgi:DNA-binding GntR family transcriptional regulator